MFTLPDMNVHTRCLIPVRLRNINRELTPYLSGDRFLYVRGDFRRVLLSKISINNNKVRVLHYAQDSACSRCRYLGYTASDVDACDGFSDDPNIVTIRSAKNVLSNYYHLP